MLLRKVVEVEATKADAIDYLRGRIKFGKFQAGDSVEVTEDTGPTLSDMSFMLYGGKERQRLVRGSFGVIQRFDESDDTYVVLFLTNSGTVDRQWVSSKKLTLLESLPPDWMPSDMTKELVKANALIEKEAAASDSPLDEEPTEDEEAALVPPPVDRITAIADRAEARSTSGWRK